MDGKEDMLERIVDELAEGGYHNARSESLSTLDKLTGGLAWCITAISDDVDFDIFYDAGATLGYKIKVGEAIEAALQKMGCPHQLQGHQIQKLDYSAVYPVVQWLVKRVTMTQEMLADELRRFSWGRLTKEHGFADDRNSELKHQENKLSQKLSEIDMLNERVECAEAGELLQSLVPMAEQYQMMQEEELGLRFSCEQKHEELLGSIRDIESSVDHSKGGHERKTELENALKRDWRKLEILTGDLAKTNQELLSYRRKVDELPCQPELLQFERCFVELDENIQAKLQETRRYFATYNALAEANELTLKEISLLNSFNVQFAETAMSLDGRTKFVASMSNIAKGVHQKAEKMEAAFLSEQNTLSELKKRHHRLVAEQRQHDNLMKLFQEECTRNVLLRSSVSSLSNVHQSSVECPSNDVLNRAE